MIIINLKIFANEQRELEKSQTIVSTKEPTAGLCGRITFEVDDLPRPLEGLNGVVVGGVPQVFAVHRQDGIADVQLVRLVSGHSREDLADQDRHLVLAAALNADAEPVGVLLVQADDPLVPGEVGRGMGWLRPRRRLRRPVPRSRGSRPGGRRIVRLVVERQRDRVFADRRLNGTPLLANKQLQLTTAKRHSRHSLRH